MSERKGILAGGHFIVDRVKLIDRYPEEDQLALVQSEHRATGGGPYNILCVLSAVSAEFPLHAAGLIGKDAEGDWIKNDCRVRSVDTTSLLDTDETGTAWTDVMSVIPTGRRTFFHYPGANMLLDEGHLDLSVTEARIFYLGYLTLLDRLDTFDSEGRTAASRVFERARAAGLITAADLVSRRHPRMRDIIASAAPHLDYLLLNELEAGWIVGRDLSDGSVNAPLMADAAQEVLDLGIHNAVILHCESGSVCAHRRDGVVMHGAVDLPADFISSTVGAGDAFAAGFLYGIHQSLEMTQCLHHATCIAAASLSDATASGGIGSLSECLSLGERFGFRQMR